MGTAVRAGEVIVDTSRDRAQLEAALADREQAVLDRDAHGGDAAGRLHLARDYDRAKGEYEQTTVRLDEIRARLARKAIGKRQSR